MTQHQGDVLTVLAKLRQRAPRGEDPDQTWTPVRFVRERQLCAFCWIYIEKASPGHTSGTRGTKAFYNRTYDVWEHIHCREEGSRALAAILAARAAA